MLEQEQRGKLRTFQIANWVLTILGVVLLTFSLTRAEDRWFWFAATLIALVGAIGAEVLRHKTYKAAQQARVMRQETGG